MDLPLPFILVVQQIVDVWLQFDPQTRQALDRLDGKVVRFSLQQPNVVLTLCIVDRQIELLRNFDGDIDVTISGNMSALMSLLNRRDALYSGDVRISGDIQTGQAFSDLIAQSELDWEELLSPLVGDTGAHKLGRMSESLADWLHRNSESFTQNLSEFAQEEAHLLAPDGEVIHFNQAVDDLRSGVDRIDARISLLEKAQSE